MQIVGRLIFSSFSSFVSFKISFGIESGRFTLLKVDEILLDLLGHACTKCPSLPQNVHKGINDSYWIFRDGCLIICLCVMDKGARIQSLHIFL